MCRSYTEQLVVLAVHLSYPICLYSMSIVYRSLLIIVNVLSLYNMNYQTMAEDHARKSVGECHPYREFEGMQSSI